ncbi:hypothetical protein T08_11509 [Trichinella sp. T8]|nr:hypothetical protein T08_11509 [Trichinella sp. T8]
MHCKQVGREKLLLSNVGYNPINYFIYICIKSCKHDGLNFGITLYTLYSEVHVAINQNAGDTSLSFENVRGTFKAIFILASRRNHINLLLIQI